MQNIFKKKKPPMPEPAITPQQNIIIPEVKNVVVPRNRQPSFTIVVGKQYIGKSFTTLKKVKRYLSGTLELGITGRKVIFFDINGEYKQFKTIPVDYAFGVPDEKTGIIVDAKTKRKLIDWISIFSSKQYKNIEARRIIMTKPDGNQMSIDDINVVLEYVLLMFTGGLLIVEDPTYYVSDTPDRDLTGTLARVRHKGLDVICHFQYKSKALNPRLWNNATFIRIHKTEDNFSDYKDRLKGERTIVYLAEILEKQENKKLLKNATPKQLANLDQVPVETFYCIIHKKRTRICGAFSERDFYQACQTYVLQNRKTALFEIASQINIKSGKPIYTFEQQVEIRCKELFEEFYGNN